MVYLEFYLFEANRTETNTNKVTIEIIDIVNNRSVFEKKLISEEILRDNSPKKTDGLTNEPTNQ